MVEEDGENIEAGKEKEREWAQTVKHNWFDSYTSTTPSEKIRHATGERVPYKIQIWLFNDIIILLGGPHCIFLQGTSTHDLHNGGTSAK